MDRHTEEAKSYWRRIRPTDGVIQRRRWKGGWNSWDILVSISGIGFRHHHLKLGIPFDEQPFFQQLGGGHPSNQKRSWNLASDIYRHCGAMIIGGDRVMSRDGASSHHCER